MFEALERVGSSARPRRIIWLRISGWALLLLPALALSRDLLVAVGGHGPPLLFVAGWYLLIPSLVWMGLAAGSFLNGSSRSVWRYLDLTLFALVFAFYVLYILAGTLGVYNLLLG